LSQVREGYRKGITDAIAGLSTVLEKLENNLAGLQKPENMLPVPDKEEKQKAAPHRQDPPPFPPIEKISLVAMRERFRYSSHSNPSHPGQQKIKHEFVRPQVRNPKPSGIKTEPPQPDLTDVSRTSTAPPPGNQNQDVTIVPHIDKSVLFCGEKDASPKKAHDEISGQITSPDMATTTPAQQLRGGVADDLSPAGTRTDPGVPQKTAVSHEILPEKVRWTQDHGEVGKSLHQPVKKPAFLSDLEKMLAELEEQEVKQDIADTQGKEEQVTQLSARLGDKPAPMNAPDEKGGIPALKEPSVPEETDYKKAGASSSTLTSDQKTALTALQERLKQLVTEELSDESDTWPLPGDKTDIPVIDGDSDGDILFIDGDNDTEQLVLDADTGEEILFIDGDHSTGESILDGDTDAEILVIDGDGVLAEEAFDKPGIKPVLLENLEKRLAELEEQEVKQDIADTQGKEEQVTQLSARLGDKPAPMNAPDEKGGIPALKEPSVPEETDYKKAGASSSTLTSDQKTALTALQERLKQLVTEELSDESDTWPLPGDKTDIPVIDGDSDGDILFIDGDNDTEQLVLDADTGEEILFIDGDHSTGESILDGDTDAEILVIDGDKDTTELIIDQQGGSEETLITNLDRDVRVSTTDRDDVAAEKPLGEYGHDALFFQIPERGQIDSELPVLDGGDQPSQETPNEPTASPVLLETLERKLKDLEILKSTSYTLTTENELSSKERVDELPEDVTTTFRNAPATKPYHPEHDPETDPSCDQSINESILLQDSNEIQKSPETIQSENKEIDVVPILYASEYLLAGQEPYTFLTGQDEKAIGIYPSEELLPEILALHEQDLLSHLAPLPDIFKNESFMPDADGPIAENTFGPFDPQGDEMMMFEALETASETLLAEETVASLLTQATNAVLWEMADADPVRLAAMQALPDDNLHMPVADLIHNFPKESMKIPAFNDELVSNETAVSFGGELNGSVAPDNSERLLTVQKDVPPVVDEVQKTDHDTTALPFGSVEEITQDLGPTVCTYPSDETPLLKSLEAHESSTEKPIPQEANPDHSQRFSESTKKLPEDPPLPPQEPVMPRTAEVDHSPFAVPGFSSAGDRSKVVRPDVLDAHIAELRCRIDDLKSFDVTAVKERFDPGVKALGDTVSNTLATIFGRNTPAYWQHAIPSLDTVLVVVGGPKPSPDEVQDAYRRGINEAVAKLTVTLETLDEKRRKLVAEGPDVVKPGVFPDPPAHAQVYNFPPQKEPPKEYPQEPVMPRTAEVDHSPFAVPGFSSAGDRSKVVRPDVLDAHIAELRCRIDDLKSFDVTAVKERFDPGVKALGDTVSNTLATIFGRNTPAYWQHAIPSLDTVLVVVGGPKPSPDEVQDAYRRGINEAVAKLTVTLETLDEKRRKLATQAAC
jgi:hypothetical protein